ncbi:MAG TPA: MerR family transcriptional regulator [Longilinea sp.]|nr:MerR family transcriptional regulator [Longilinea sp.]
MYRIGDFARLCGVSIKTLRYYDEIGLLKPGEVDRFTRYRYYTDDQQAMLQRILGLKELGFTLEQIQLLLPGDLTRGQLIDLLKERQHSIQRLQQQIADQEEQIKQWLQQLQENEQMPDDGLLVVTVRKQRETKMKKEQIIKKEGFIVVGLTYHGKNENHEIPHLWDQFDQVAGRIQSPLGGAYGICAPVEADGSFDYLAGFPVASKADVPEGMVAWEVPAQTYVVFEANGIPDIGATYSLIVNEWMPKSGYQPAHTPDFEYYPPEFDAQKREKDTLFIYFPIEKA